MANPIPIDDLSHEEIRNWLVRALQGQEPLPLLTRDEYPYLAILRLEKTLKPATRDSLRDNTLQLVRQFCADGKGETAYLEELLALGTAFKQPEFVQMLAQLAERFPDLPHVADEARLAVLAALVDAPPPQSTEFWERIFKQAPEKYAGLVLSGMLAINPTQAIQLLPKMPDNERAGQATALKLDLTWDDLLPKQRYSFVQSVQANLLMGCGQNFAGPIQAWVSSKSEPRTAVTNPSLFAALLKSLGPDDAKPHHHTPKLCESA